MKYRGNKLKRISFPLGGIGTGCIGLAGNGELIDWEIFNRPNKNTRNGYSHFAIKAKTPEGVYYKVLHGDTVGNLSGEHNTGRHKGFGYGIRNDSLAGFPHFEDVTFDGKFPLARVDFDDKAFPGEIKLLAFNPFIPHNAYDSSLPVAMFEWEIHNTTDFDIDYTVALSVRNPSEVSKNKKIKGIGGTDYLLLENSGAQNDSADYFNLSVATDCVDQIVQECWYRSIWMDSVTMYWNNFTKLDRMPERSYADNGQFDHGTVAAYVKVAPGEKKRVRFVISWYVPNQFNYWMPYKDDEGNDVKWKNYYATCFSSSAECAEYALKKFDELKEKTVSFTDSIHSSSLSPSMIDAVTSNLSVLKSPTVLRLEDGSFWGWEGCSEDVGSCEGSCQHVWNYAYALPFLFPELERSLRDNTMKYSMDERGATKFRVPLPLGRPLGKFRPCLDGQMGEVIKCYREWKMSGNDTWLTESAPAIFKMIDFAFSPENCDRWDLDMDGVLEGRQHHTLDMELFGPSSWLQGFYLLALDCGARIADKVGQSDRATLYRRLYESGKAWTNEHLFNGRYYNQKVDLKDKSVIDSYEATQRYWNEESEEIKYQIAEGCIIDQMLSDWHASIIGLPGVFDEDKKRIALKSLYKNNFVESMRGVENMWRNFAVNDEGGTIICSYPEGTYKQTIPIPYCEETMTGFEYALAGLMAKEGFIKESEIMTKAIRDRYDGEKRNPWNEIECGSNYARSMASYALLPIFSGFSFDMTKGYLGFSPIVKGKSRFFFSIADSCGDVYISETSVKVVLSQGTLKLNSFGLPDSRKPAACFVDSNEVPFLFDGNKCVFLEAVNVSDRLEFV